MGEDSSPKNCSVLIFYYVNDGHPFLLEVLPML